MRTFGTIDVESASRIDRSPAQIKPIALGFDLFCTVFSDVVDNLDVP
jgi:hypothetical protein